MIDDDDEPRAFPHEVETCEGSAIIRVPMPGMTLRDYFAAKALGALAGQFNPKDTHLHSEQELANLLHAIALLSYGLADEMLDVRK